MPSLADKLKSNGSVASQLGVLVAGFSGFSDKNQATASWSCEILTCAVCLLVLVVEWVSESDKVREGLAILVSMVQAYSTASPKFSAGSRALT